MTSKSIIKTFFFFYRYFFITSILFKLYKISGEYKLLGTIFFLELKMDKNLFIQNLLYFLLKRTFFLMDIKKQ